MRSVPEQHFDHSGGAQAATNQFLRARNEVEDVVNGDFSYRIGSIARRLGFQPVGDTLVTGKPGLGLFEAKFSTGAKIFGAISNSGATATLVKGRNSDGTWTDLTLPGALPANTKIQMLSSLDDMYIAGKAASGARISIINVKNDLTTSITRNLIGAPKARFIAEYGGSLYAINVEVNGTTFPDRAYKSSPALSVITFTRGDVNTDSTRVLPVDSVRYLKDGVAIDIFDHKTNTARYTNLTIAAVDKGEDTITLPPRTSDTFATSDVNTSTDIIGSLSGMTLTTGTPLVFTSTVALPAPLVANTVYYAINQSSTSVKLATTAANAAAGIAIDLTDQGTGTHTGYNVYTVSDNDEICLTGRRNELYYMWNTDYPTNDKADFLKIPSGAANNSEIVGWAKTNERLLLFTDTTTHKWDGAKLTTRYEDIGCASHDTIKNIGDWVIWLDTEGRVNAYNDATGQYELISKSIQTKYLEGISLANLQAACALKLNNIYKLSLGTVGDEVMRLVYDFDSNNWTRDKLARHANSSINSYFSGRKRSYFVADNGKFYIDDEGNDDDGVEIPLIITYGRDNSGTSAKKSYQGFYVYGENMSSGRLRAYRDGKSEPIDIGELNDNISNVPVGAKNLDARYISLEVAITAKGDRPIVDGYEKYVSIQEDKYAENS